MGYRDRSALFDLLFEDRNNGTVGAQYISETHRHKFRLDILEHCPSAVFIRVLHTLMGEELGNVLHSACLNLIVKGLDNHFAKPFACPHDIGRIYRLIRGDQHKALTAIYHGRVGGFVGPQGIVLNAFARAVLHQGHMLMSRCMINDFRSVLLENLEHSPGVSYGANQDQQIQFRKIFP